MRQNVRSSWYEPLFYSLLDMRSDIQKIFKETPINKQVMMFSATMSDEGKKICRLFMKN